MFTLDFLKGEANGNSAEKRESFTHATEIWEGIINKKDVTKN